MLIHPSTASIIFLKGMFVFEHPDLRTYHQLVHIKVAAALTANTLGLGRKEQSLALKPALRVYFTIAIHQL